MSDRDAKIGLFLEATGFGKYSVFPIPNDASPRRYFRLEQDQKNSVILMDAPPTSVHSTPAFVSMSQKLSAHGYSVPTIIKTDFDQGLLLLSDLGDKNGAAFLAEFPDQELNVFREVLDVVVSLEKTKIDGLDRLTPSLAGKMVRLAAEQYADIPELGDSLAAEMTTAFETCCRKELFLSLRDFHMENIIWRDQLTANARVGLLDFQDAFLAPQGYDLMSLLRDVRRDLAADTQTEIYESYIAKTKPKFDFYRQFACLAVQRNLRILGVFARLVKDQGKTRYLDFIPRTWRLLQKDLRHPALSQIRNIVEMNFPDPNEALLESWLK